MYVWNLSRWLKNISWFGGSVWWFGRGYLGHRGVVRPSYEYSLLYNLALDKKLLLLSVFLTFFLHTKKIWLCYLTTNTNNLNWICFDRLLNIVYNSYDIHKLLKSDFSKCIPRWWYNIKRLWNYAFSLYPPHESPRYYIKIKWYSKSRFFKYLWLCMHYTKLMFRYKIKTCYWFCQIIHIIVI